MSNSKRFDRHAIFTSEMMDTTMEIIKSTEDHYLKNMTYGLYDGYLYEDLLPRAIELGVSEEVELKIRGLKNAIEMSESRNVYLNVFSYND